jgi:hypothetical protein
MTIRVSDWVSVVNRRFSHFPSISWREVNFQWDDDEVRFVLEQHAELVHFFHNHQDELDVYSASSLKQQTAGGHVAPLWQIILILSLPVFTLSPYCIGVTRPVLEYTTYRTRGEHA